MLKENVHARNGPAGKDPIPSTMLTMVKTCEVWLGSTRLEMSDRHNGPIPFGNLALVIAIHGKWSRGLGVTG